MRLRTDNRGSAFIIAYIVLFALVTLCSGVALLNFSEIHHSRRYYDSTAAFWLAEAGVNTFFKDPSLLGERVSTTIPFGRGMIHLRRDDSDPRVRKIISNGLVSGSRRSIQVELPARAPEVFESTISAKGDLEITGKKVSLAVNGRLRLSGKVNNGASYSSVLLEDKQEGAKAKTVTMTYPDANNNGRADEFNDFVAFNRNLVESYPREEVVYIKGNSTYTVMPHGSLKGKKIVYVEGGKGAGNVVIQYVGEWGKGENITIISTGTVTLNHAGSTKDEGQMNVIAWEGYNETALLPGRHNGIIYTHGTANFFDIHDTSVTNGAVAANDGIKIGEVWSTKTFNYFDPRSGGAVPPGFEGLVGGGTTGYILVPVSWREI
ncbi:MAG: hypothetical protein Q8Q08_10475 [Candidatus Omnitrophota bacterium]|nr:hypothetical protein [Candidatus Omnitrophota bacterium]MDZ4243202.1 hypothetical protein [Candidatus Omnitrophota bacterium]